MAQEYPTSLGTSDADKITLLGQSLADDLMGKVGFGELTLWMVTQRRPTPAHVRVLLDRAVARGECGPAAQVDPAALEFLASRSGGDARTALNGLELACQTAGPDSVVGLQHAEEPGAAAEQARRERALK